MQIDIQSILFYLFAAMTAGSAIGVVASRNIVRTSVFLLFALTGVAGVYFLLEAEFLAAVQLVIYVGGTLILIVFGVMLTSKSPFSRFEPSVGEVVVAVSIGAILLWALGLAYLRGAALLTPTGSSPAPLASIATIGQALLGQDLVPFEVVSVLLLVVMIGAAYLARGRRDPRDDEPGL